MMRRIPVGRRHSVPVAVVALLLGGAVATWAVPAPQRWTVPVGRMPVALAVDARSSHLFVADSAADSVTLLDARTGAPLATTIVGQAPVALAVDEAHGRVYTLNACVFTAPLGPAQACPNGAGSVSVLDLSSGALLDTWGVGGEITALAVDERAGRLVAADGSAVVQIFDGGGDLLRTVVLAGEPQALAVDAPLRRLFISTRDPIGGRSGVSMFDSGTGALLVTVRLGHYVGAVLSAGRAGRVLVSSDGDVYLLNARTGRTLRRITDGGEPLAVDERNGCALISGQGHLRIIATRDGAPGPRIGPGALDALAVQSVAVDAATGRFYVATDDALWVLNDHSGQVRRVLAWSQVPVALAVDAGVHRLFILASSTGGASSSDRESPVLGWLRRTVPGLPFLTAPSTAAHGTLTVLDTTRL